MSTIRLILGDQLNMENPILQQANKSRDIILMCEVWNEASYVKHHQKKIAFIFSAMRHFAKELIDEGFKVDYIELNSDDNTQSFTTEVKKAIATHEAKEIIVTYPGEYRVLEEIQSWGQVLDIKLTILDNNNFICSQMEFASWASGRKQLRMEFFYRELRKKHNILMHDGKPIGGKWNYDAENRKPAKVDLNIPAAYSQQPDNITREVMELVKNNFSDHFGDIEPFYFAVTREQALLALDSFIKERLASFGDYQDAMLEGEPWMYHSHLSFYINIGLLQPMECIKAAESAYQNGNVKINAAEGFIRQILGWREFINGIYWLRMPEYENLNYFNAKRTLPQFYWTAETDMNCLRQCITETKQNAYAHHIQRLMVLGNFALLAGIDPEQVNEWYLIVYADAYQWVELPNVTGMILFADGGYLASKPYAASGAYINKMSNYCKNCQYKVSVKTGEDACPFNYLYWDFLIRNREKLKDNQRLAMIYKTLDKMDAAKQKEIIKSTNNLFKKYQL